MKKENKFTCNKCDGKGYTIFVPPKKYCHECKYFSSSGTLPYCERYNEWVACGLGFFSKSDCNYEKDYNDDIVRTKKCIKKYGTG